MCISVFLHGKLIVCSSVLLSLLFFFFFGLFLVVVKKKIMFEACRIYDQYITLGVDFAVSVKTGRKVGAVPESVFCIYIYIYILDSVKFILHSN